jgi:hypothetical protein
METFFDRFKEKPIKISGGVSTNEMIYWTAGIQRRQDPYSIYLTGNLNCAVYGWNIPLTFVYSNRETQFNGPFQQSFNQFSITPYYRWVKLYLGNTSMNFSSYTMSGYPFLGAGVELTPPNRFRLMAMYGRFKRAVAEDTTNQNTAPSFRRMGYAIKIGYGSEKNSLDLVLFKAADVKNSLNPFPVKDSITPAENLTLSLIGKASITEEINLSLEYATSAYTSNTTLSDSSGAAPLPFRFTDAFIGNTLSTSYYNALKTSLTFNHSTYSIGLNYERIDPDYQTMGAYYFNNDVENISLSLSNKFLAGKLNVAMNGGYEHNNLDHTKGSTLKRYVGACNISYSPGQNLSLNASYSNFSSYTNMNSVFNNINQSSQYANIDTMNYVQVTQTISLSANIIPGSTEDKEHQKSLSLNLNLNRAADKQGQNSVSGNNMLNGNMSYSYTIVPKNLSMSAIFNVNLNQLTTGNTYTLGPSFMVSKLLFDKQLRNTLTASANTSAGGGSDACTYFNVRINETYTLKKKHNFNLSFIVLRKQTQSETQSNFTEFTITGGYAFNF